MGNVKSNPIATLSGAGKLYLVLEKRFGSLAIVPKE